MDNPEAQTNMDTQLRTNTTKTKYTTLCDKRKKKDMYKKKNISTWWRP